MLSSIFPLTDFWGNLPIIFFLSEDILSNNSVVLRMILLIKKIIGKYILGM